VHEATLMVVLAAGLTVAACSGDQTATSGRQRVPVTVFAAASLNDVFTKLEPQFEAANPGADLRVNFGGSSDLA
jgi:molybdate transport system substrate-binding protein